MGLVHVDMRKWLDRRHWQFAARRLGEDEHGTWLHVPSGTVAQRGDEPARPLDIGFVGLVPVDRSWVAEFYVSHPWHAVYVNIGTPPVWDGDRVTQVDLDLDVVRTIGGSVEVLDEDEFELHSERYEYPAELIRCAREATDAVVALLTSGAEPFGAAAEPWLARGT